MTIVLSLEWKDSCGYIVPQSGPCISIRLQSSLMESQSLSSIVQVLWQLHQTGKKGSVPTRLH